MAEKQSLASRWRIVRHCSPLFTIAKFIARYLFSKNVTNDTYGSRLHQDSKTGCEHVGHLLYSCLNTCIHFRVTLLQTILVYISTQTVPSERQVPTASQQGIFCLAATAPFQRRHHVCFSL